MDARLYSGEQKTKTAPTLEGGTLIMTMQPHLSKWEARPFPAAPYRPSSIDFHPQEQRLGERYLFHLL